MAKRAGLLAGIGLILATSWFVVNNGAARASVIKGYHSTCYAARADDARKKGSMDLARHYQNLSEEAADSANRWKNVYHATGAVYGDID